MSLTLCILLLLKAKAISTESTFPNALFFPSCSCIEASWKAIYFHEKAIGNKLAEERKFIDMKLNSLPSILTLFKPRVLFFKACIWTRLITRSTPMRSA